MSKLIFLELTTHTQGLAYAPDSTIPGAYVSTLVVLILISITFIQWNDSKSHIAMVHDILCHIIL